MRVAICDDEDYFVNYIKDKICYYNAEIFTYTNGYDVLKGNMCFDIAFVDIDMDKISGFHIAKKFHEVNKNCIIVFFTSHAEFATKGYEFNAFRYILKKESSQVIERQIVAVFKEYNRKNRWIQIFYKGSISNVSINDITYIETFGRILTIHTDRADYQWYNKLKDIEKDFIPYGFIRCHKSYLVNLDCVKIMTHNKLVLYNNKSIPIGRNYKKDTEFNYVNFKVSGELS